MAAALFTENAKWRFEETHGYTYICVCEFFRFRVLRYFFGSVGWVFRRLGCFGRFYELGLSLAS